MDKNVLIKIALELFNENIDIVLQTVSGKWYEQKYEKTDFIETEKVYGICFDGSIYFTVKMGKNEDNFVKSFITQFINKHEIKKPFIKDGKIINQAKEQIFERLKNNDRVFKGLLYTTLYGIGFYIIFNSQKNIDIVNEKLSLYLKSQNIDFKNEYSEAMWVYRYVINKDVNTHNNLLSNFTI